MSHLFEGKRILVTGGTGSLGKTLIRRLLSGTHGMPDRVTVFSRDEARQHQMRVAYLKKWWTTEEIIYHNYESRLRFHIGDVRNVDSVSGALRENDIVFNAAALKQVPTCEYFPFEAVQTNILGAQNIVKVIRDLDLPIETVVGISTDKAVKPVNVMGMTKSVQERIFTTANLHSSTRFVVVRYGNVLASRGSVVPLFHHQIREGGPVTITDLRMTRFLLSLDDAVDVIFTAVGVARPGETLVPRVPSAKVVDIATALIGNRDIKTRVVGTRPGEKIHEILISEEELPRVWAQPGYYTIAPILPELGGDTQPASALAGEYSSANEIISLEPLRQMLLERSLMVEQHTKFDEELLS